MTRARKTLVDPETTSYNHCIGRCVRRAWLWGEDRVSGRNYEHRKSWVLARLAELAEVFTLDVCAYAVMSNHYHLVVRLNFEKAVDRLQDLAKNMGQSFLKGNGLTRQLYWVGH